MNNHNNKCMSFVLACLTFAGTGCASTSLEDRVNYLESALFANDRNLKLEAAQLYTESQQEFSRNRQELARIDNAISVLKDHITNIEDKTDKLCVYMPNSTSLQIFPAGQCPQ